MSKKIIKQCELCGIEFKSYKGANRRFCSPSCSSSRHRQGVKKEKQYRECPICHNLFIVTSQRTKHCSNKCRHIGHRINPLMTVQDTKKIPELKKCLDCDNTFIAKKLKKRCKDCQRLHANFLRKKYQQKESWKKVHNIEAKKWQRNNKKKVQAASRAHYHPEWVEILYTCPCVGINKENHPPDYKKPFEVWRVCHACHMAEHRRLRYLQITTSNEVAI